MERKCRVEGCDRTHYARGFCIPHYRRARRQETVWLATAYFALLKQRGQEFQRDDAIGPPSDGHCRWCEKKPVSGGLCRGHYNGARLRELKRAAREYQALVAAGEVEAGEVEAL
jgi:hypothetical protein